MNLRLLLPILGTILMISCGQPKSRNEEKEELEEKAQALEYALEISGVWTGSCGATVDKNLPAGSAKIEYSFRNEKFIEKLIAYDSEDCSGERIYEVRRVGNLKIHEARDIQNPLKPRKINLMTTSIGLNPYQSILVDHLNTNKTCSITNWAIGRERPISGRLCWGINAYPLKTFYTVFALTENDSQVCFGKTDETLTGNRESERPAELGSCYKKVVPN